MRPWLLAALLTALVVPSSALLVSARAQALRQHQRSRDALGDVLVDTPTAPGGLLSNPKTLVAAVGSRRAVGSAQGLLVGPVLLGHGDARAVARLEGVSVSSPRYVQLQRLVAAGGESGAIPPLGQRHGQVALGVTLARALGVGPGQSVEALSLSPGSEALGFRRRTLKVAALLKAGLTGFDAEAAVTSLEDAKALFGSGDRLSGVQALLGAPLTPAKAREAITSDLGEERRARHRLERDFPEVDDAALLGMAQSTLLTVLFLAVLILPLGGIRRRAPYRAVLQSVALPTGLALVVSIAAGFGLVAIAAGDQSPWSLLVETRTELGRLFLTAAIGVLLSPLLVGRLGRVSTAAALAAVIALATVEPAGSAVVASGARRTELRLTDARAQTRQLASSGPLPVALTLGAEVIPAQLIGLDPRRAEVTKLLQVLCQGQRPVNLRPGGSSRPSAWSAAGSVESLLDQLADRGEVRAEEAPPSSKRGQRQEPPIVLGRVAAHRLGVSPGDSILVSAAPLAVSPSGELEPPWPRTFRVAATAQLGLRSADQELAFADTWHVEALGGRQGQPDRALSEVLPRQATHPFATRARRSALASTLQITLAAFLLGAMLASLKGRWSMLLGWCALGLVAGLLLGFNEGAGGLLEIGDADWYEVLPRGRATVTDLLGSSWGLTPALAALAAASLGLLSKKRRSVES